jgi:hypothetical protein
MQTVVSKADDRSIVISQRNAAGELDYEYDRRTGMRIASSFYNILEMWQRRLRLEGRE